MGGEPAVRWRSEAFRSITCSRTSAKSKSMVLLSAGGCDHVTLATSAMDVTPFLTFSKPSARSGRIPCAMAIFRISSDEAAAHGFLGLELEGHGDAGLRERGDDQHGPALAVRARPPHEPLGDDAD